MKRKTKNYFTIFKTKIWYIELYALFFTLLIVPALGIYCLQALNSMTPISVFAGMERAEKVKEYAYNELVPQEVIKAEIVKDSDLIGCDKNLMFKIASCESGFNNLLKNNKATATGVFQFIASTWQNTQSFKKERIAVTEYKANVREACLRIAIGDTAPWNSSKSCWNK